MVQKKSHVGALWYLMWFKKTPRWFKNPTLPHYLMIRYSLGIRDLGLVGVEKNLLFYNLCVIFSPLRVFLPSSFLIFALLKGKNRVSN